MTVKSRGLAVLRPCEIITTSNESSLSFKRWFNTRNDLAWHSNDVKLGLTFEEFGLFIRDDGACLMSRGNTIQLISQSRSPILKIRNHLRNGNSLRLQNLGFNIKRPKIQITPLAILIFKPIDVITVKPFKARLQTNDLLSEALQTSVGQLSQC